MNVINNKNKHYMRLQIEKVKDILVRLTTIQNDIQ